MTADRNLPVTTEPADDHDRPTVAPRRPISVAFLPLALVTFIVLALTIAAWTFLATAA